ncbi:MAG: DUF4340 domain-containing protein [Sphingobacteriaceae bacterium]|nr:DUF4340 domain-containing protein [Sphingobacteriaceae bacterium]
MSKKSTKILLAVFSITIICAIIIYKKKGKASTVDSAARDFKIKDTASITRIFIADKEGDKSNLQRTKSGWIVNDKYPCRTDAILNLMEAIRNVEVKMPVNKKALDNVIKVMASSALKIEIYNGDELVKQYYIGHETPDSEGSYMLLTDIDSGENFDEPFVCFIPGFVGYLIPRYIAKESEWRDRTVINFIPPQIKSITVKYTQSPDSSFGIQLTDTKTFSLLDSEGKQLPFDEFKMKQYIAYFQNLQYEGLITGVNKKLEDSLHKVGPFAIVTVNENNFRQSAYKFYYKKASPMLAMEHGVKYDYDPDRMFLRFENDKEWALVQNFVFGKLLINSNYFLPATVKK